jgi:hypothetical protein
MADVEDVLDAIAGADDRPALVELGRTLRGGDTKTTCAWSTGAIGATIGRGKLTLRRLDWDEEGKPLVLTAPDLGRLHTVCARWVKERDRWAAFYGSSSGYPPGCGGAEYYQAPGKDGDRDIVSRSVLGRRTGTPLRGKDEARQLDRPRPVARGVAITHEIWRAGERQGPKSGSLVGVRYQIGSRLQMDVGAPRETRFSGPGPRLRTVGAQKTVTEKRGNLDRLEVGIRRPQAWGADVTSCRPRPHGAGSSRPRWR